MVFVMSWLEKPFKLLQRFSQLNNMLLHYKKSYHFLRTWAYGCNCLVKKDVPMHKVIYGKPVDPLDALWNGLNLEHDYGFIQPRFWSLKKYEMEAMFEMCTAWAWFLVQPGGGPKVHRTGTYHFILVVFLCSSYSGPFVGRKWIWCNGNRQSVFTSLGWWWWSNLYRWRMDLQQALISTFTTFIIRDQSINFVQYFTRTSRLIIEGVDSFNIQLIQIIVGITINVIGYFTRVQTSKQ